MKATRGGRTFEMTRNEMSLPALQAELIRRGFDGFVYFGNSKPVGRQRKEFNALFYRSAKTGEFVFSIAA